MDFSFLKRGFAGSAEARLDYGLLVTALQSLQASSAAARAEQLADGKCRPSVHPMADLLLATPAWPDAVTALRGSFNRAQAETIGKAVATQMTETFTVAF